MLKLGKTLSLCSSEVLSHHLGQSSHHGHESVRLCGLLAVRFSLRGFTAVNFSTSKPVAEEVSEFVARSAR